MEDTMVLETIFCRFESCYGYRQFPMLHIKIGPNGSNARIGQALDCKSGNPHGQVVRIHLLPPLKGVVADEVHCAGLKIQRNRFDTCLLHQQLNNYIMESDKYNKQLNPQLSRLELLTFNEEVVGSSPTGFTQQF